MKVPNFPERPNAAWALLECARADMRRSIAVVGPGKDVGKTVTAYALANSAQRAGLTVALTSVGRDGEVQDVTTTLPKPRLVLPAGSVIATATVLLPRSPAVEVLEVTEYLTALGPAAIVRLRAECAIELGGPSTGAAMRELVERLKDYAELVIIDGAVDRLAATAGGDDAVVVATGAAIAPTLQGVVEQTRALIERLTIPGQPPARAIAIEGALTPSKAVDLLARPDLERGVAVRDPLSLQLPAALLRALRERTHVSCRHPLHVVAATVAAHGRERDLDPVALAAAVARATGLRVYDLYRNAMAAA